MQGLLCSCLSNERDSNMSRVSAEIPAVDVRGHELNKS